MPLEHSYRVEPPTGCYQREDYFKDEAFTFLRLYRFLVGREGCLELIV